MTVSRVIPAASALRASRPDPWITLKDTIGAIAGSGGSLFLRKGLVAAQVALSFLLLIGMSLIGEGWGQHIPKGYIYFAMGFSVFVEAINLRIRGKQTPVHLRQQAPH